MMTRDLTVGGFVLAGLMVISYLSVSVGGLRVGNDPRFTVYALFDEVGGLTTRSPVVIGGVKVGDVRTIELEPDFRARVELSLEASLKLPKDTSASILTAGVLGNQYVGLQPGAEEDNLESGDYIELTESAVILERLLGRVIQNLGAE
jgi:phospholipid/cholesterol/gamma-HCH transport system substrate-binding protein